MRITGGQRRHRWGLCGLLLLLGACAGQTGAAPTAVVAKAPPAEALIGASWGALINMLGEPDLVRHDQDVEVWQYPGQSCVLLLYLYKPETGGDPKTAFIDARDKQAGAAPVQACLAEVVRHHAATKH